METEWDLIPETNYHADSEEEFANEDVPLLDIERGIVKIGNETEDTTNISDDKPSFSRRSKKRPRQRSHSCMNLTQFDRVNYVISGSGFLEPATRKRLKLSKDNFVRIDISPDRNTQRLRRNRSGINHRDAMYVIAFCILLALFFIFLTSYVLITENSAYHSYKNITPANETIPFSKWFQCRY